LILKWMVPARERRWGLQATGIQLLTRTADAAIADAQPCRQIESTHHSASFHSPS
jgi:hypothetical protein